MISQKPYELAVVLSLMEEERAKQIVERYLRKRSIRFSSRKTHEAGPDIMIEGKAIEVKGSNFDQKEALVQLVRYVSEYAGLTFAFPLDRLNLTLLYGLYCIERAIHYVRAEEYRIKIMLVVEQNNQSYLKHFESVEELVREVQLDLEQYHGLLYGTNPEEIRTRLETLLEDIESTIRNIVLERITSLPLAYHVE